MNIQKWSFYLLILAFLYSSPLFSADQQEHPETKKEHGHESEDAHADGDIDIDIENEKGKHEGGHEEHDDKESHADGGKEAHGDEENKVHLSAEQLRVAGIVVVPLTLKSIPIEIEAPGEIKLNDYASSQVTPRIEGQITARLVKLGDHVKKGQPMVTLSSAPMAEAQAEAIVAAKEWQRIKKLGSQVVSEQALIESRINFQQTQAKLLAYGMTPQQVEKQLKGSSTSAADGSFTLLSPQDGTVIHDDFIVGKMIDAGDLLFEITDETTLWVEARVNPELVSGLVIGASGRVRFGGQWIEGKVIQAHHDLDEKTRTLGIRLEIPNPNDHLHPGQFVTARFEIGKSRQEALALPVEAVLRSPDGDWQVFVEDKPGEFEPKEVEIVRELPELIVIEGLAPGTRVVTKGAFFVQSELAKSGFEVHNH